MNQSQRERLALVLSRAMQAALTESPDRVREVLEDTLRELAGEAPAPAPSRGGREPRRRHAPVREAAEAPEAPFSESDNRKAIAGFLDVMVMASGTVGRFTADRLLRRLFPDRARGAERWLLSNGLVQASEEEALQITEDGLRYLEKNREGKFKSYVGFEV